MKDIPIDYKVDEGVPVPVRKELKVPVRDLKVGQSVAFPIEERAQVQNLASRLKRREGREYTVSKEDEQTARIWRVK